MSALASPLKSARRDGETQASGSGGGGGGFKIRRPILLAEYSVNHRLPSGPAAMPTGKPPTVGTGNSVIAPEVVIRPILLAKGSVNHNAPSEPAAMTPAPLLTVGMGNSAITPEVVI